MIVTDTTIYNDNIRYAQTNDTDLVFLYMKAYFAHFVNGVKLIIFFVFIFENLNLFIFFLSKRSIKYLITLSEMIPI